MADLHKYQRSKERLIEILTSFNNVSSHDKKIMSFIINIKNAISVIDNKIKQGTDYRTFDH